MSSAGKHGLYLRLDGREWGPATWYGTEEEARAAMERAARQQPWTGTGKAGDGPPERPPLDLEVRLPDGTVIDSAHAPAQGGWRPGDRTA